MKFFFLRNRFCQKFLKMLKVTNMRLKVGEFCYIMFARCPRKYIAVVCLLQIQHKICWRKRNTSGWPWSAKLCELKWQLRNIIFSAVKCLRRLDLLVFHGKLVQLSCIHVQHNMRWSLKIFPGRGRQIFLLQKRLRFIRVILNCKSVSVELLACLFFGTLSRSATQDIALCIVGISKKEVGYYIKFTKSFIIQY